MRFWLGGYTADMDGVASGIGMLLAGAADDALGRRSARRSPARSRPPTRRRGSPRIRASTSSTRRSRRPAPCRRSAAPARRRSRGSARRRGRAGDVPHRGGARRRLADRDLLGRRARRADDAGCRGPAVVAGHRRRGRRSVRRRIRRRPRRATSISRAAAACAARGGGERVRAPRARRTTRIRATRRTGIRRPPLARAPGGLPARTASSRRPTWASISCGSGARRRPGCAQVQQVVLPLGTGPRHMVQHPSGHLYVVAELSCEVFVLGAGCRGHRGGSSGGRRSARARCDGDTAAEISTSRDGEFLYAGVRGSNTHRDAARARAG